MNKLYKRITSLLIVILMITSNISYAIEGGEILDVEFNPTSGTYQLVIGIDELQYTQHVNVEAWTADENGNAEDFMGYIIKADKNSTDLEDGYFIGKDGNLMAQPLYDSSADSNWHSVPESNGLSSYYYNTRSLEEESILDEQEPTLPVEIDENEETVLDNEAVIEDVESEQEVVTEESIEVESNISNLDSEETIEEENITDETEEKIDFEDITDEITEKTEVDKSTDETEVESELSNLDSEEITEEENITDETEEESEISNLDNEEITEEENITDETEVESEVSNLDSEEITEEENITVESEENVIINEDNIIRYHNYTDKEILTLKNESIQEYEAYESGEKSILKNLEVEIVEIKDSIEKKLTRAGEVITRPGVSVTYEGDGDHKIVWDGVIELTNGKEINIQTKEKEEEFDVVIRVQPVGYPEKDISYRPDDISTPDVDEERIGECWSWTPQYSVEVLISSDFKLNVPAYDKIHGGDPIDLVSGFYEYDMTDLEVIGRDTLTFDRNYTSDDRLDSGMFGKGWRFGYERELQIIKSDRKGDIVSVIVLNGKNIDTNFITDPFGKFYSIKNVGGTTLEYDGTYFILKEKASESYKFDNQGKLVEVFDENGNMKTLSYSGDRITRISSDAGHLDLSYQNDRIVKVTDNSGRSVDYGYTDGLLTSVTNPDGDSIEYTYDNDERLKSITDFAGEIYVKNTYDDYGRIVYQNTEGWGEFSAEYFPDDNYNIINEYDGKEYKITYDDYGRVISKLDVTGGEVLHRDDNFVNKITDELGNETLFEYDEDNELVTKVSNPDGSVYKYEYNANGNVTKEINPDGTEKNYSYDSNNNLISFKDENANIHRYEYNSFGDLIKEIDPEGLETLYEYNSEGNITKITNPSNEIVTMDYDSYGRLIKTTTDSGSMSYEYTDSGKFKKVTDQDGNERYYTADENGMYTQVSDAVSSSNTVQSTYAPMGEILSSTDYMGNTTEFEYVLGGKLSKKTFANGSTEIYTYDEDGNIETFTNKNGHTFSYKYDDKGQKTKVIDPLSNTIYTEYDEMGRVTASIDKRGLRSENTYNSRGFLTKTTDPDGNSINYTYDNVGNVLSIKDKNGNITRNEYNSKNQLVKQINADGSERNYKYDGVGRVDEVEFEGTISKSHYNTVGELIKVESKDSAGTVLSYTTYEYDSRGNLVVKNDSENGRVDYTYDENSRMTSVKDALNNTHTYEYDLNGNLIKETDPYGNDIKYSYDNMNRLTSTINKNNEETKYKYDNLGNLVTTTDSLDGKINREYNSVNQLIKVTDKNGNQTKLEYDENSNVVKTLNPDGGELKYVYDNLNRVSKTTDPEGNTLKYQYDANGNVTKITDARGNNTLYTYDSMNRVSKTTDSKGNSTFYKYDEKGRLIKLTDKEGVSTNYSYDALDRLHKLTNAEGNFVEYTYDTVGRVKTIKDEEGEVTKYTYDLLGNIKTEENPKGGVTKYEYDKLSRLVREYNNNLGNTIQKTFEYDNEGLLTKITDEHGHISTLEYDSLQRVSKITDENGEITKYEYDKNSNVIATVDAKNTKTKYEYDSMNRLIKVINPQVDTEDNVSRDQITIYEYDKNGMVVKEIDPLNNNKSYEYDENNNLVSVIDKAGKEVEYTYDVLNRNTNIKYSDGSTVLYAYDKEGRLVKVEDETGTTTIDVDDLGRIVKVTDPKSKVLEYTYTAEGQKQSIKYPEGMQVNYTYDDNDNLEKVITSDGETTTYSYDALDRLISKVNPTGEKVEYAYNDKDELVEEKYIINSATRRKHQYNYDDAGNLISEQLQGIGVTPEMHAVFYEYDELERLTKKNENGEVTNYSYDTLGNITSEILPDGTKLDYKYDIGNRLQSKNNINYEYDLIGNLKKETSPEGIKIYEYDDEGRLVAGKNEKGEESHYTYNGLGARVETVKTKTNPDAGYNSLGNEGTNYGYIDINERYNNTPTINQNTWTNDLDLIKSNSIETERKEYLVDYTTSVQNDLVVYEEGSHISSYVYGLDRISSKLTEFDHQDPLAPESENIGANKAIEDIKNIYYMQDRLGSTIYTTIDTGEILTFANYDEWGAPDIRKDLEIKLGATTTEVDQDMLRASVNYTVNYTNHEYDEVLDLYYAKNRHYNPEEKRFIQPDPVKGNLENPQTLVPYTYVLNNPNKYVDPDGNRPEIGGDPDGITLRVDGVDVKYDNNSGKPFLNDDGLTMVPLRKTFEAAGVDVKWENGEAIFTYKGTKVTIKQGKTSIDVSYSVDNYYTVTTKLIDGKVENINGRLYAPIRAIAEGLDISVEWDQRLKTVNLVTDYFHNGGYNFSLSESDISNESVRNKIRSYMRDDSVREAMKNGEPIIFSFEGAGEHFGDITYAPEVHEDKRYSALTVVMKPDNGGVYRVAFSDGRTSTLPGDPMRTQTSDSVSTIKQGIYQFFSINHQDKYASIHIGNMNRNDKGEIVENWIADAWRYGSKGLYSDSSGGINFHTTNEVGQTDANWSTACQLMQPDVYGKFLYELGVVNSDKENNDFYKSQTKYDNYVNGIYIVDRSILDSDHMFYNK